MSSLYCEIQCKLLFQKLLFPRMPSMPSYNTLNILYNIVAELQNERSLCFSTSVALAVRNTLKIHLPVSLSFLIS